MGVLKASLRNLEGVDLVSELRPGVKNLLFLIKKGVFLTFVRSPSSFPLAKRPKKRSESAF